MRKYRLLNISSLLLLVFMLASCDYYLGINQQPDFEDRKIVEGLNIFGLLRPDSIGNYNRSFVFIQQIWPALEYESFAIIQDAEVLIEYLDDDSLMQIILLPLVPADEFFNDTLYRSLESFIPQAGRKYKLTCRKEGFPDAIGTTIIPAEPAVIPGTFNVTNGQVSFSLTGDSLFKMIDIYLVNDNEVTYLSRTVPLENADIEVMLNIPVISEGSMLYIYVYDSNLASYYGNANTSLNFNKYRTTITTLESGFGVFGSLNYLVIPL
jgi:hypothetical protein